MEAIMQHSILGVLFLATISMFAPCVECSFQNLRTVGFTARRTNSLTAGDEAIGNFNDVLTNHGDSFDPLSGKTWVLYIGRCKLHMGKVDIGLGGFCKSIILPSSINRSTFWTHRLVTRTINPRQKRGCYHHPIIIKRVKVLNCTRKVEKFLIPDCICITYMYITCKLIILR